MISSPSGLRKPTSKIVVQGYHGKRNTGDDLFCYLGAAAARAYWGTQQISFLTPQLPVLPEGIAYRQLARQRVRGQLALQSACLSAWADQIVYMGGSIFHSAPRGGEAMHAHNLLAALTGRARLAGVGVSLGPFRTARDQAWIEAFLRKFSFLAFRDHASYALAQNMDLPGKLVQAFDLAALLLDGRVCAQVPAPKKTEGRYRLGVSVCDCPGWEPPERLAQNLLGALRRLARRHPLDIQLLVFNDGPKRGDAGLTQHFAAELSGLARVSVQAYDRHPLALWQTIRACDGLVGIRLHSAVLAYLAEIPFALLEYHPKCGAFLETAGYASAQRLTGVEELDSVLEKTLFEMPFTDLVQLAPAQACQLAQLNFTAAPWCKA